MHFTSWFVLLATLALWSGNWIVARALRDEIAPGIATVGRLLIVLAILAPFVFPGLKRKLFLLGKRDWRVLWALGFTGGGVHLALQWLGLHYTTATSGILYLSTSPIFILIMAAPLATERIGPRQWAGVAISFAGVATIASRAEFRPAAFNIGDLMALGSMVMWAAYTVLLRVRRDALNTAELIVMVCALGLVFMAPWLAWDIFYNRKIDLSAEGALGVVYSAIGSMLLAYAGWSYVVTRLGAARAGITMHLMPAMGVALAAMFLGEYPRWYHFAGIAMILAGVGLSSFKASSVSSNR
jgi:drug/metabolite transporter (DMT)-like permease